MSYNYDIMSKIKLFNKKENKFVNVLKLPTGEKKLPQYRIGTTNVFKFKSIKSLNMAIFSCQ